MVVSPGFFPVTTPEEDTVATEASVLLHTTFRLLAFTGRVVAFSVSLSPARSSAVFLFSDTFDTGVPTLTVMTIFLFLLAFDVMVIFAVPFLRAFSLPLLVTDTIFGRLLLNLTPFEKAPVPNTFVFSLKDFFFFKVSDFAGRFVTLTRFTLPFDAAAVCLAGTFFYPSMFVPALAAAFMALIVRIVKNSFEAEII